MKLLRSQVREMARKAIGPEGDISSAREALGSFRIDVWNGNKLLGTVDGQTRQQVLDNAAGFIRVHGRTA